MTEERLQTLRTLIDAKIAAHMARLEAQRLRTLEAADECMCRSAAEADVRQIDRMRSMPRGRASSGILSRLLHRLPKDLPVPSPEPRPPNLNAANLSFAARVVIAVRDRFGGDAPAVYAAAKVTRQAYSQIVSDETHSVSKRTAVRFAFALHCTKEEARLLLKAAGYAFSNSQTEDFILQSCLEVDPPIWDLDAVNELLREYRVDFQY